jgi:hypothetical protein
MFIIHDNIHFKIKLWSFTPRPRGTLVENGSETFVCINLLHRTATELVRRLRSIILSSIRVVLQTKYNVPRATEHYFRLHCTKVCVKHVGEEHCDESCIFGTYRSKIAKRIPHCYCFFRFWFCNAMHGYIVLI